MPIVFFENFSNDTPESIILRYPGSYRDASPSGFVDDPKKWPLTTGSTFVARGIPEFDPMVNNRIEIVLGMSGDVGGTSGASRTVNVFGLQVSASATTNIGPSIAGVELDAPLPTPCKLHIILDLVGAEYRMTALVNDVVVITPTFVQYKFGGYISRGTTVGAARLFGIPDFVDYVVVAFDTPIGTRLQTPTFSKGELTLTDAGEFQYSDQGIIADTDTNDPNRVDPNIYTITESVLKLGVDRSSSIYITANADLDRERLEIDGLSLPIHKGQTFLPKVTNNVIDIATKSLVPNGVCNNDNVCFLGEIQGADFATFEELSTLCGITAGTLNNITGYDTYLHFIMDGEDVIVPKVTVRRNVNWQQIYQAGCVYGYDGFGSNPSGPPVNQNKIITIKGKRYKVSLLKGLDGSLPATSRNDLLGTYRSEWSRLFYPICRNDTNIKSYTGPKLASYTKVELGMEDADGRSIWVQETPSDRPTHRFYRGSIGPSYLYPTSETTASNTHGWRPALRLIPE